MKRQVIERQELKDRRVDIKSGLNSAQIEERISGGYINDLKIGSSKSLWNILAGNIFTFFNLLCFLIFIWLISITESFEDMKNTTFMFVIIVNTSIGVIQELKAKSTMDKLSLLSSPEVKVLREKEAKSIRLNEILLDDIVILEPGNQICSDSVIVEGSIEVNESLLTGESLPIKKGKGDKLLSGSFVISGNAKSKAEKVGKDSYIQQLTEKAKELKKNKSELIRSIKLIMRIIGIIILPLSVLSFLNNFNVQLLQLNEQSQIFIPTGAFFEAIRNYGLLNDYHLSAEIMVAYKQAVIYTSASIIGMIPIGMFLLTSVALAVGIIRLAKKRALVQNLFSIEALARVNMLCLDKTGTITDGSMRVNEVISLRDASNNQNDIISSVIKALNENNQTAMALKEYFVKDKVYEVEYTIPFSSERKCSAAYLKGIGLCVIGAPEYVIDKPDKKTKEIIDKELKKGNRCLMFAVNSVKGAGKDTIPQDSVPHAVIVLEDNIKKNAADTIKLFKEKGVEIKVISGDNPLTVSEVAKRVNIDNADKYISLKDMPDDEVRKVAMEYNVFGRVSPAQKKLLIEIFKGEGRTVAMTGDGVNDILALKEADCSIAMAKGSEAARNVAQIVLLDSDFDSMPAIVNEGRRVINNVERASSLFLTKTMFSILLMIFLIFLKMSYPIEPIQLTFTSMLVIGLASFVLALEPNKCRLRGRFITNIMKNIIPPSISLVISVLLLMLLYEHGILRVSEGEYRTIVTYTIFGIFMLVLYNISKPFNVTRLVLNIGIMVIAVTIAIVMPILPNQAMNLYKLSSLSELVSITLLFSLLLIAYNVIRMVDYIIKNPKDLKKKKFTLKSVRVDEDNQDGQCANR